MVLENKLSAVLRPIVYRFALAAALAFAANAVPARAGVLAVTDLNNDNLYLFNSTTGAVLHQTLVPSVGGNPSNPKGVVFGPDGNVYVADQANGVIDRFNPNTGAFLGEFVTPGLGAHPLFAPTGLTFGPNGDLFVDDFGMGNNSFINEYNGTTGAYVKQFVPPGVGPASSGGLFDPGGLIFQGGNLYVADSSAGTIDRFDGTTGAFTPFVPAGNPPSPLANPQDVKFDASGNAYVTDLTNSVVYKYSPAGTFLGAFVPSAGGLVQPIGLAFANGNLYVADGLGRVATFNGTTGAGMADLVSPGTLVNPQFLAFSLAAATPEPSTFLLIALGVIGLGWFRRAHRQV
jgi:streptogramin lyase